MPLIEQEVQDIDHENELGKSLQCKPVAHVLPSTLGLTKKILAGMQTRVECCVDCQESADNAIAAGCRRIELCSSLTDGGVTPSLGLFKSLRKRHPDVFIAVLVRVRAGSFVYSESEVEAMREDVLQFKTYGANGVVIGALNEDSELDFASIKSLSDLARPEMEVTLHRAIDVTVDPEAACQRLGATNLVDRVLTSGGETSALIGADKIALMKAAAPHLVICAGGGITPLNAKLVFETSKADQIHGSFREQITESRQAENKLFGNVLVTSPVQVGKVFEELASL